MLLALTSLAPVAIVYAAVVWRDNLWAAIAALVVAALAVLICLLELALLKRRVAREAISVRMCRPADKEVLAFLLAYTLPLLASHPTLTNGLALAVVAMLLLVVLYRANLYHVNPLLGFLGYHFYDITKDTGQQALLVTQKVHDGVDFSVTVVQVFQGTVLEVEDERGGAS